VCENKWYVLYDAMEMNASVHTLIVYVTLHQNVKLFLCKTAYFIILNVGTRILIVIK
jgi:hypothetical protein